MTTGTRRVLVTGAAGRLGSRTVEQLAEAGHDVVATDAHPSGNGHEPFFTVDLLDHAAVGELMIDVDVVVQLANHPGLGLYPPQAIFNENVSMNTNVFQAAAEHGVGRVVFASSVQLIGSHVDARTVTTPPTVPMPPLRSGATADPSNLYALSKLVSERILRYYAERCGLAGVALRFPLLHEYDERVAVRIGRESTDDILECFSGLTYDDAARLVVAVVESSSTGFEQWQPGTAHRHLDLDVPELVRRFYPGADPDLGDLIDATELAEAVGWTASPEPDGAFGAGKDLAS